MSNQVIIFTNQNGGVSVCYPTGEMSIQQVLDEHCPEGAIIVNNDSIVKMNDIVIMLKLVLKIYHVFLV